MTASATPKPALLASQTRKTQVYDALRGMIIDGRLAPGETIRDGELAALLGVSNTPVREALARLQQEGLVEAPPYRGKRIAPLSRKASLDQIELIRIITAALYPRAIDRLDDAGAVRLRASLQEMRKGVESGDRRSAAAASLQIHDILFAAAGNDRIRQIAFLAQDRLERTTNLIGHFSDVDNSVDPTTVFVEAVIAKDVDLAMQTLSARHDAVERAVRLMAAGETTE